MPSREDLLHAFRRHQRQLWVVGGAVRDRLRGLPGADEDFATDALPDQVEAIAAETGAQVNLVGQRFGTVGVFVGGRWTEITTFRGDSYAGGTRWPEVTFGASIEEDLARRDFTINAIAEDALGERRLDLYGGAADIQRRLIRAGGEPVRRFPEDPLRILRGLRFASQLDFEVAPETLAGMRETTPLLATLSQERITAELDRLLQGEAPSRALNLLRAVEALPVVLPEFAPMPGCEQNRFHHIEVWGHTLATVTAIEPGDRLRLRRWAAFFHDLGKPAVRHLKANGEWGFYRHETVGAELAAEVLERLKVGRR